ncbi:hypothetical protein HRI_004551900 [Hibiscus trionum]|uniref:Reverse transcriptase n=1 Tax=Hibiscus trionum TaxID=183268 RepID=A0A9W7J649_HIBTR|nr:hypothetical protein HRI_004551900 [Hibiscus trionum]
MEPLKAPGLDEIHAMFYQKNWEIVRESVCNFVRQSFSGDRIPMDVNRTSIVLIPKIKELENFVHFRPISLCPVIYKVLTKCIVNRLKPLSTCLDISDSCEFCVEAMYNG